MKKGERGGVGGESVSCDLADMESSEIFSAVEEPFRKEGRQGTAPAFDLEKKVGFDGGDLRFA